MSNGLKGLTLAAGVIITCMVISIGFFIAGQAKDIAAQGSEQIGYYAQEMANSGISFYDGLSVSGGEVERVIKHYYQKTGIWVKQKNGTVSFIDGNSTDVGKAIESLALNKNGSFVGEVEYDEKGKVECMKFRQE